MKLLSVSTAVRTPTAPRACAAARRLAVLTLVLLAFPVAPALAQKLPSPEKVVGEYVKAVGGKKRLAAVRDASYVWVMQGDAGSRARVLTRSPSYVRTEVELRGAAYVSGASERTAWRQERGGPVQTLTGAEAHNAKLQAILAAGRLLDLKKRGVLARTAGTERVGGEQAYVVEFSRKEGGRLRYSFGASSRLLLKIADPLDESAYLYGDYRAVDGILEPHSLARESKGARVAAFTLESARYNTALAESLFEPPGDAALDVPALLRELIRNQGEIDQRVNDYTFTRKTTERKVNDRGEVTKETVTVHEVYPFQGYGWVMKLVSEDGRPLSTEKAAKEELRVAEELAKAEREAPKNIEKWKARRAEHAAKRQREGKGGEPDDTAGGGVGISTFLRACEFVSPRRERFREREAVVFDFRPRPGFKPSNSGESIVSKLSGTMWIDPAERQVMRLEARLVEGYKMGGGLVASIKPGSNFVFEQTRVADQLWLPRFTQLNASARVFLFKGMSINQTSEFSDYKLFTTKSGDAVLDGPKQTPEKQ
jgi:hypothetical protein